MTVAKTKEQQQQQQTTIRNPSLVIVAGTYDGVLAGWEARDEQRHNDQSSNLELTFATPVHQGSIRSLCMAAAPSVSSSSNNTDNDRHDIEQPKPGTLLSCGYDEDLKTHDFGKKLHSSGQVRTPADFGTPTCSSFAPPPRRPPSAMDCNSRIAQEQQQPSSTHCLLGFSGGKLVLYKKRDWSIQHVLAGHDGGVASVAVHPSGKLALTGGHADGKVKLWDLTKGRLAYVTKCLQRTTKSLPPPVDSLEWSVDGSMYAWCCGNHVTVRATDSGKDLLDADLPCRVNEICLMEGKEGVFVAAAGNDGSLPVLAVQALDTRHEDERRAILAIEPVDNPVAGEERFKCIKSMHGYRVVTCNSAGVVSVMNLEGAVKMIMSDRGAAGNDEEGEAIDDENDDEDEELAVDIVESVRLGSGARITCLSVWHKTEAIDPLEDTPAEQLPNELEGKLTELPKEAEPVTNRGTKRKADLEMDSAAVERARALVKKAKRMKKKRDRKEKKAGKS